MPRDRVLPKDVILGEFVKMDLMKEHPKREELCDMLGGDRGGWIDLEDPCVVLEGLPHLPSTNFSCHTERGSPRYRRGKEALAAGRLWVKQPRSRWVQWMGTIELLRKLVQRPVTSPKPLKMHARFFTSLLIWAKKITASTS